MVNVDLSQNDLAALILWGMTARRIPTHKKFREELLAKILNEYTKLVIGEDEE